LQTCIAQTKWFEIPLSSFSTDELLNDDSTDGSTYLPQNNLRSQSFTVAPFAISKQITLGEYLHFVDKERKLKGSGYAEFLLPERSAFSSAHKYHEYLTNPEYKSQPVAGVSWKNARRYVLWRNTNKSVEEKKFLNYRLPTIKEWQAAYLHLLKNKIKYDISILADWTSETYEESQYEFSYDLNPSFEYESVPCDPPTMKRKTVVGNSWLHRPETATLPMHYYGYQDSGYAQIGFRLVSEIAPKTKNAESPEEVGLSERDLKKYPKELKIEYIPADTVEYSSRAWKVKLVKKEKLMTGSYMSWYSDGILKTKGQYLFNQKVGSWYFYDNQGMTVLHRYYINNYVYKDISTKTPHKLAAFFKDEPLFSLARNNDSEPYKYPAISESNILYSKRYWIKNVQIQNLWGKLKEGIQNKSITLFTSDNGEMADSSIVTNITSLPEEAEITGYRMKLDFYFDSKYMMCLHQVIGIAPEVKTSEGTIVLGWIYYPQIRGMLANACTRPGEFPVNIQHLDDLLFFRYYAGDVYKVSNIYDREEPNDIDPFITWLDLLETEHSLLISLYKK
jgi:hypothetical protein